jgi:NAD(P)-dependent dehydrogenase (short-subunit alcohol dehydrogenase family)
MASLILFWCSARASLITGQSVAVDGGHSRHIW